MPAKRAYGMDQEFYPWSPIVTRPVLKWPDNARVALAVIVNLEHWDWEVPPGTPLAVSPMGGPAGLWSGGGAHGTAPGGKPRGRTGGVVERNPAAIPRHWRLRQPRIRQPGRDLP